ncbi:iron-containing redox enzyme family protein [Conexibacter woesei]|uniref:Iron-containing redox enzyme family protein n=1 Tax=Conexibacter woesei (strain DSM 14684 / CCUG 47730 / CIP 108061 / JCM 11494 / NBRC 100937 / ID131577) TaxID=469383 RepID=D3F4C4_CONWI|nr:iron-containing redox enzyme family protein [Conexibacter woesei]ADB50496.1 hypothetical protein Cwoe_2070 [Conexibacter woesei DSM 14684]
MATTVTRPTGPRAIELPAPRGPLSERLFTTLRQPPGTLLGLPAATSLAAAGDPLVDDDLQLTLYVSYELHYSDIAGVDPDWEWDPGQLAFRATLERPFEAAVRRLAGPVDDVDPAQIGATLQTIAAADDGPPLSRRIETGADAEQVREFLIHRSAYQLKEADPHSWAIPRLAGGPKAALVEIQTDEYGGGDAERIHAVLFAKAMRALGLDAAYGAHLERLPAITLATVNLMSLCGLHRRLRGAIVGHLAAFEMTSSLPNRRYGNALRRLGCDRDATDFFDEHVTADAVHENIAAWDLAGGLAVAEPQLAADIVLGARALLAIEARWADHLLTAWDAGSSSLRPLTTA